MAYIVNDVPANCQSLQSVLIFNGTGQENEFALGTTIANVQSINL